MRSNSSKPSSDAGLRPVGDFLPLVASQVLRAHQGRKIGACSASSKKVLLLGAAGQMHLFDKQAASAHPPAPHDGAPQGADLGTHVVGRGGNRVTRDGRLPCSTSVVAICGKVIRPALFKFGVLLPEKSRSALPSDLHTRRFVHANTFAAYLRVWSAAGFEIEFDGPNCASIMSRPQRTDPNQDL